MNPWLGNCSAKRESWPTAYFLFSLHSPFANSHVTNIIYPCTSTFGLFDENCVAKVFVMSSLYARSQPTGSRQNLHTPLRRGSIWL